MTIKELARLVSDDFQKTMNEEGFETFNEMRRCYCWETQDIKEEVSSIINEISAKVWEERKETVFMYDDYSTVIADGEDMSWRDFKKLIFENLK